MNVYKLKLYKTYYNQGFFNVPVDYDHLVRKDEGPIEIRPAGSSQIRGQVNRSANQNGTARIMGRVELRDWFQSKFNERTPKGLSTADNPCKAIILHLQLPLKRGEHFSSQIRLSNKLRLSINKSYR